MDDASHPCDASHPHVMESGIKSHFVFKPIFGFMDKILIGI